MFTQTGKFDERSFPRFQIHYKQNQRRNVIKCIFLKWKMYNFSLVVHNLKQMSSLFFWFKHFPPSLENLTPIKAANRIDLYMEVFVSEYRTFLRSTESLHQPIQLVSQHSAKLQSSGCSQIKKTSQKRLLAVTKRSFSSVIFLPLGQWMVSGWEETSQYWSLWVCGKLWESVLQKLWIWGDNKSLGNMVYVPLTTLTSGWTMILFCKVVMLMVWLISIWWSFVFSSQT